MSRRRGRRAAAGDAAAPGATTTGSIAACGQARAARQRAWPQLDVTMPRFRPRAPADLARSADPRQLFDDVFRPCHFYVGPDLDVTWQHRVEMTLPWEIYQGRLLDAAQTRRQRTFLAWTLTQQTESGPADRPLVALLWDSTREELHVVRSLLCHVWESYDGGGNVIQSRETSRWMMELVGTLTPAEFADVEELRDEVICRIWQAVIGN